MDSYGNQFGFGIETEHLLIDERTFRPLFHEDFSFDQLLEIVDEIPTDDISTFGFNIKPLHKKAAPYLIEGYYLTDSQMKPVKLLPKGIEVRTPIVQSIDDVIFDLRELTERLRVQIAKHGWRLCSISHHPSKFDFQAPPNYRRHDYWQWALTAMTTYGPDINISVADSLAGEIDSTSLSEKINYYLPPMVALTFNSPIVNSNLWQIENKTGKSVRTFKRSLWAPLYYVHNEPSLRFEFKGFEMAQEMNDYRAMFLFGLVMLFDNMLKGRAPDQERIDRLRDLSVHGLIEEEEKDRARAVLESAEKTAFHFNFDSSCLEPFWQRLEMNCCPADRVIEIFRSTQSIGSTMRELMVAPLRLDSFTSAVDSNLRSAR